MAPAGAEVPSVEETASQTTFASAPGRIPGRDDLTILVLQFPQRAGVRKTSRTQQGFAATNEAGQGDERRVMRAIRITPGRRIYSPGPRPWLPTALAGIGIALFAFHLWMPLAAAQDDWRLRPPTSTGPAVGDRIPAFRAPDQNGQIQDFNSIKGPNGAALYFMRSTDW